MLKRKTRKKENKSLQIEKCYDKLQKKEKLAQIIKQIPNIKDACVIGKKNLISGEEIIAFIQSEKKINTKKIMNFLVKNLPSFSIPRKLIFIKQIPKNIMKKNDREKLYKFI